MEKFEMGMVAYHKIGTIERENQFDVEVYVIEWPSGGPPTIEIHDYEYTVDEVEQLHSLMMKAIVKTGELRGL